MQLCNKFRLNKKAILMNTIHKLWLIHIIAEGKVKSTPGIKTVFTLN